jgi:hypothetical protein
LTGLALSFLPLPAGRSGCVKTASGVTPESQSARSEASAKSGVPANKTLLPLINCFETLMCWVSLNVLALLKYSG